MLKNKLKGKGEAKKYLEKNGFVWCALPCKINTYYKIKKIISLEDLDNIPYKEKNKYLVNAKVTYFEDYDEQF